MIRKLISVITGVVFILTGNAYSLPVRQDSLRPPMQGNKGMIMGKAKGYIVNPDDLKTQITFGTAGWRAPVGEGYSLDNVRRMAQAIAEQAPIILKKPAERIRVAVGYDARILSREFAIACVEVLAGNGIDVDFIDQVTPTPVMAEATRQRLSDGIRYDFAIHITASHNPLYTSVTLDKPWQGMKLLTDGVPADDKITQLIAQAANDSSRNSVYKRIPLEQIKSMRKVDLIAMSNERLRRAFDFEAMKAKAARYVESHPGFRLLVDPMHGATVNAVKVLQEIGIPVLMADTTPIFEGVETGAVPKTVIHPATGKSVVWAPDPTKPLFADQKVLKAKGPDDMALLLDGDGDRLVLRDIGGGREITPNEIGLCFAEGLYASGERGVVVRTLPTTRGLDLFARRMALKLRETPVGSKHFGPFVVDGTVLVAVEESGHVVFKRNGEIFVDSAVAEALQAVDILITSGMSLTDYLRNIEERQGSLVYNRGSVADNIVTPEFKNNVSGIRLDPNTAEAFVDYVSGHLGKEVESFDTSDPGGILIRFKDGTWCMYRVSGTENVIRIYGEETTKEKLNKQEALVQKALQYIVNGMERGSVFGLMHTIEQLGIKAGDKITVLGIQLDREKTGSGVYSPASVRNKFTDAEELGIIRRLETKDEKGRGQYEVLVSLTKEQLAGLPTDVKTMLDGGRIKEEEVAKMRKTIDNLREKQEAGIIAVKLTTPLDAKGNSTMAASFLRGGYRQEGYGVAEGAAIHGSFARTGNQGYYVQDARGRETGKQAFLNTVNSMSEFFKNRTRITGKPIKYIIKTGIGGQHTPFQGIADTFQVINAETGMVMGEYELGKDFEADMINVLRNLVADWDQVVLIPSSKSGSTDETMMVFVEIFYILLKHQAIEKEFDGSKLADVVLGILHEVNFINDKERPGKDLFKVDAGRFSGTDNIITLIADRAKNTGISRGQVKDIFAKVLGNMFFETTDRVDQSRLSAFIHNSGLDVELGENAPGFGAMFDNVGGRWTGDLHMMVFLAYHNLDAERYWEIRKNGIVKVNEGRHTANILGNKILDEGIGDIALVVPDKFFWFGKACEQNFNESIWQKGFANLVAIKQSMWDSQKSNYAGNPKRLVINMSGMDITGDAFNVFRLDAPDFRRLDNQGLAGIFGELFTTFYGMTTVVGNRLIARALKEAGYGADDVDLNDLNNPATKIVQENLYTRQPYVELGKSLLESRLKALQEKETANPGAIEAEFDSIKQLAREGKLNTNIQELNTPSNITNLSELSDVIRKASEFAKANGRKFVPFIYLEGDRFYDLRDYLISLGIEWVMQGTGDQHISYQQVLAQPAKYLPFIISFVPEKTLPGRPAIGFAKGYLHNVSPHMVRDLFAEASYNALTDLRKEQGGLGLFLRMTDSKDNINMLRKSARLAAAERLSRKSAAVDNGMLNIEEQRRLQEIVRVDTVIKDAKEEAEYLAARKTADLIISKNKRGEKIVIGFATGGTYEAIYKKLIEITRDENISWENVVTFNLDEYVWKASGYNRAYIEKYYGKESYASFMTVNLFGWLKENAGLKEENIHLMNGMADDPEKEVEDYEALIMRETGGQGVDLQVLGIGVEGHIAFIEARPDMPLDDFLGLKTRVEDLAISTREANSRFFDGNVEAVPPQAMTQGISTILKAKEILLVATGSGKREAITKTIAGNVTPSVPASVLQAHPNTTIILDANAAQGLIELSKMSMARQAVESML